MAQKLPDVLDTDPQFQAHMAFELARDAADTLTDLELCEDGTPLHTWRPTLKQAKAQLLAALESVDASLAHLPRKPRKKK